MNKAESSGGNASQVQMGPVENQIVVYQPNETIRLDVRMKCCQCENVASGQFQFPIEDAA